MAFRVVPSRAFVLFLLDVGAVAFAIIAAFFLRIPDFRAASEAMLLYWWIILSLIIVRVTIFRLYGFYNWAWQYASLRELVSLAKGVILGSLFLAVIVYATNYNNVVKQIDFPYRVVWIDFFLCLILLGAIRVVIRMERERRNSVRHSQEKKAKKEINVLIVGAGDAGVMIAREMLKLPSMGYKPVAFIDDNLAKKGQFVHQVPILSDIRNIPEAVKKYRIDEIIIAIPSSSGKRIREIVEICKKTKAKYKIVPGMSELINDTVSIKQIRDIQIDDLLRRESAKVDLRGIAAYLSGARVLVTGAGGSIGSELCRQIALFQPAELILLGKGENSIFEIENELRKKFPYLSLNVVIGDIRSRPKVAEVFKRYSPNVVFHAAAHKHVPLMENNPDEAVLNNIIGTETLSEEAERAGVQKFVMVSSDKAVNPTSVMGATKRVAEMIVQAKAMNGTRTKFVSVRFGNVLDSRGSVIPLFKKQIAGGGPVTVTHPDVRRYFMTIPEAV